MSNRLSQEHSLYLLQHANNPVHWHPWGQAALDLAQAEDKPILVSIGYSAWHWCHVMAHESFEDENIAELMNKVFVCIKVDREERPDVDKIYMDAQQMLHGQGGWPLNSFLLPDGRPFSGGTYFPPDYRRGQTTTWPEVIRNVFGLFASRRDALESTAEKLTKMLQTSWDLETGPAITAEILRDAAVKLWNRHDKDFGGFGSAPKFPPSMSLNFLIQLPATSTRDFAIQTTLDWMAYGGLFDQIGGGFARYSVDPYWKIPHFEKMLYDNSLLLDIYTKGWVRYRSPLYKDVVYETVAWLVREMWDGTGFAAALDADTAGHEGTTYVWTPEQIQQVLGEDAEEFCRVYDITSSGNFEHSASNPNIPSRDYESRCRMQAFREKLLEVRNEREQPGKDGKHVVYWNSLMAAALWEAGWTFGEPEWVRMAQKIVDSIWEKARFDGNRLYSVIYGETAKYNGYLDDYAGFAYACLQVAGKIDWVEKGASSGYLEKARETLRVVDTHFSCGLGYAFTSDDHETLIRRSKDIGDNAYPCGNSVLLHAFWELEALDGEGSRFAELAPAIGTLATRAPSAVSHSLAAFAAKQHDALTQITTTGSIEDVRATLERSNTIRKAFVFSASDNTIKIPNTPTQVAASPEDLVSKLQAKWLRSRSRCPQ